MCEPKWAIVFHSNSQSPRAKKWYRVSRVIHVDGKLFELYWHPLIALRTDSRAESKSIAQGIGLDLLPGIYRDAPSPRSGSELIRADRS